MDVLLIKWLFNIFEFVAPHMLTERWEDLVVNVIFVPYILNKTVILKKYNSENLFKVPINDIKE